MAAAEERPREDISEPVAEAVNQALQAVEVRMGRIHLRRRIILLDPKPPSGKRRRGEEDGLWIFMWYGLVWERLMCHCVDVAVQGGRLADALEILTPWEKRARQVRLQWLIHHFTSTARSSHCRVCGIRAAQVSDARSSAKVCVAIVQCCFRAQDWDNLIEQVELLAKKRGQSKRVRDLRRRLPDLASPSLL